MKRRSIILLIISVFILIALILFAFISTMFPAYRIYHGPARDRMAINRLEPTSLEKIDRRIRSALVNYNYINLAIIRNGRIVLTKSYGYNRLNRVDVYASVSKPVTAMILLQLLKEGKINSLDDDIAKYHPKYGKVMPPEHAGTHITFRQLLNHTGGVPHQSKLWDGARLKLHFPPGEAVQYSSNGYGILGDIMERITGKSYRKLIKQYISNPIGAESFTVLISSFLAPAGQVASTIEEMARFAIAVMDGKYISTDMLCNEVLKEYAEDRSQSVGLGWYCTNLGTPDLAGYHAGSNGRPRAFLAIKPHKKNAIALTGLNRSAKNPQQFGQLAIDLMAIIENPTVYK
jgi:CubicO group peptidase (beta-lactamase class C family)